MAGRVASGPAGVYRPQPLDLAPDEAYYWDWSRRPAWGYFSKPPLVAWLIALSTGFFGTTSFTVRLPAVVLMTLTTWTLFAWARRLYDSRTAFWAAVTLSLTPAGVALGALMTPDAPLVFFWTLALYLLSRALQAKDRAGGWWLGVGLAVGLGLLSKQTMLAFPVLTGVLLLANSSFRHHLRRPGPYLGLGLALLWLTPVLWWNQGHHWITFWHTTHHFQPSFQGLLIAPAGAALFVGGQLLIFSPLVWLLMVAVGGRMSWPRAAGREGRALMLVIFGFWPLLGVLGLSLFQPVNPNWPAVFYPAGMVLLAAWAGGRVSAGPRLDRRRRLFMPAMAIGAAFALATFSLPYVFRIPSLAGSRIDTTARLRGWQELGRAIGKVLAGLPRRQKTFLLAHRRQEAGGLAFYVPGRPRVYQWRFVPGRIESQYHIWPDPTDRIGWDALVVWPALRPVPSDLIAAFKSVRLLTTIHRPGQPPGRRGYAVYLGRGLIAWPR
ncbi:MAG: glycosyltransferase family 39 protein [Proteobacteria bacterium]|nr:glycosyltransferase family 39 protein [Pseudomonadota bacterium]